jgi:hypothetical protein
MFILTSWVLCRSCVDSTPISRICNFIKGLTHVVENCPYWSNQLRIFVIESIFDTTQLAISISSQIPMIQVLTMPKHDPSFTITPSYPID